jgi:hypothetical protein
MDQTAGFAAGSWIVRLVPWFQNSIHLQYPDGNETQKGRTCFRYGLFLSTYYLKGA